MNIQHAADNQEFTTSENGHPAELAYSRPDAQTIDFTHTFVDEALRGRGLADELARAALTFARQEGLKVKTSCTFMKGFVEKHATEYKDLAV